MDMEERLQPPFVQFLQERAAAKAIAKATAEAKAEANLKAARSLIMIIVEAKYPQSDLLSLASRLVEQTENLDALRALQNPMILASTCEQTRTILLNWAEQQHLH